MLFLAPLFWATSNVTGKLGKAWLSPYAFTFWRWLLATALLSLLFRRQIRADWPQLKARAGWLFVVGGSGFALFNVVLYGAFARGASVVNVSMITALIPLAVLLVDVGFLRGRAHPLAMAGGGAVVCRRAVAGEQGRAAGVARERHCAGRQSGAGQCRHLCGYSLALRRAPPVHWASLLWAMCAAATLVSVPFYAAELWTRGFHLPPWQGWLLLAYVVLFVSILSKLFYMESVLVIGASRAALTMNLLPVFGALVGVAVFADERLGGYVLVALALVAAGIGLSEWGAMRLAFRRGA